MPDIRQAQRASDGRISHWEVAGPAGIPVRLQAEEISRVEGREIAWRTTEGHLIAHQGMIRVDHEAAGTRVLVELSYNPVAGAVGHALATLLGADPAAQAC